MFFVIKKKKEKKSKFNINDSTTKLAIYLQKRRVKFNRLTNNLQQR